MKKNIFSIIAMILVFSLISVCFVACGGNNDNNPPAPGGGGGGFEDDEPYVTKIELVKNPTTIEYMEGDVFDPSGIELVATWSHGVEEELSRYDITYTPNGALTADTEKVVIAYEGKTVDVPIIMTSISIKSLAITQLPTITSAPVGTKLNFEGLKVTATLEDDTLKAITSYRLFVGNKDITESVKNGGVELEKGAHTISVNFKDKSATFTVTLFNGYIVEAEKIIETAKITVDDKNFIEKPGDYRYHEVRKAEEPASDGAYMGDISKNAVIKVHIWSDVARKADIIMRASSGVIKSGDGWGPSAMSDIQLNQIISAKGNNNSIAIADTVVLPGGATADGSVDWSLWVKWMDVTFGEIDLKAGDNIIEVTIIGDKKHATVTANGTLNIDRFEVQFKD